MERTIWWQNEPASISKRSSRPGAPVRAASASSTSSAPRHASSRPGVTRRTHRARSAALPGGRRQKAPKSCSPTSGVGGRGHGPQVEGCRRRARRPPASSGSATGRVPDQVAVAAGGRRAPGVEALGRGLGRPDHDRRGQLAVERRRRGRRRPSVRVVPPRRMVGRTAGRSTWTTWPGRARRRRSGRRR